MIWVIIIFDFSKLWKYDIIVVVMIFVLYVEFSEVFGIRKVKEDLSSVSCLFCFVFVIL